MSTPPIGRCGRSSPGRLRRLDGWLIARRCRLLTRQDGAFSGAPVVELGLGEEPWSALELRDALAGLRPAPPLVGLDVEPGRVARARAMGLDARPGGFSIPLERPARLIRAMNVLRGYPPARAAGALRSMAAGLAPGGLLVEGSASPRGEVICALLAPRSGRPSGLLLMTDFSAGFAPAMFFRYLPQLIRGRGGPADRLLLPWEERRAALGLRDPRAAFSESARGLPDLTAGDGWALWRPAGGL